MKKYLNNFSIFLVSMPRVLKQIIILISDIILCWIALAAAFYLRIDQFILFNGNVKYVGLISTIISIPIFGISIYIEL